MDMFTCEAEATRQTNEAIRVDLRNERWSIANQWIPISVLGEDSEVFQDGHHGTIHIAMWWAVENGLVVERKMPTSPLLSQKVIAAVVTYLTGRATFEERCPPAFDALCDCGQCSENSIGWHVGQVLREAAAAIKETV